MSFLVFLSTAGRMAVVLELRELLRLIIFFAIIPSLEIALERNADEKEFPLLYPIEMILNIPPSDRTHEGHIRDSSRRRRYLHVIKRTVESGTVSISQIVYVTPAAS